jgi:tagatose-6-phosphate ketose/aldose isomerase
MFNLPKEELERIGAYNTAVEIKQQPQLWIEVFNIYKEKKSDVESFLKSVIKTHGRVRIIFTGAGTSSYVGDTIVPYLKTVMDEHVFDFTSVATTNLVSNPHCFLKADIPTILVSFARSGNSPESIAAVNLAKQIIKNLYQITITCAAEGKLAQNARGDDKNLLLLMPQASNDRAFAMTGSFTCMTLCALLIFNCGEVAKLKKTVEAICSAGKNVIERENEISKISELAFKRIVYLGSGCLAGLAREAQLKILELTAGKIATLFDSSLGFRHGPKSFIDKETLAVVFVSNDKYTKLYDQDILNEINGDKIALAAFYVGVKGGGFNGKGFFFDRSYADIEDVFMTFPYIMLAQTIALQTSVKIANRPDTPSFSGTVNRVVQGVTIHNYKSSQED